MEYLDPSVFSQPDADLYTASVSNGTLEDLSDAVSMHVRWTGVYSKNGYNIQVVTDYMFAVEDVQLVLTYRVTNLGSVAIKNVTFVRCGDAPIHTSEMMSDQGYENMGVTMKLPHLCDNMIVCCFTT